jgi:hypothetical protein
MPHAGLAVKIASRTRNSAPLSRARAQILQSFAQDGRPIGPIKLDNPQTNKQDSALH